MLVVSFRVVRYLLKCVSAPAISAAMLLMGSVPCRIGLRWRRGCFVEVSGGCSAIEEFFGFVEVICCGHDGVVYDCDCVQ